MLRSPGSHRHCTEPVRQGPVRLELDGWCSAQRMPSTHPDLEVWCEGPLHVRSTGVRDLGAR